MAAVPVWLQLLGLLIPVTGAAFATYMAYRSSTRTKQIETTQIANSLAVTTALERQKLELALLTQMRQELDRLHNQAATMRAEYDKVSARLADERDLSFRLREEVASLRRRLDEMTSQIESMRERLAAAPPTSLTLPDHHRRDP